MKNVLIALACSLATTMAAAQQRIDPATTGFPWMNSSAHDAQYRLADHKNVVHVFEAYSLTCHYCNENAVNVDALATQYMNDPRVAVLDLGLDVNARDYANWIATHHPNHPVVKDVGQKVFQALKQEEGIPQTFVVDCTGTLVGSTVGEWGDAEKQTLRAAIAKAEQTSCN